MRALGKVRTNIIYVHVTYLLTSIPRAIRSWISAFFPVRAFKILITSLKSKFFTYLLLRIETITGLYLIGSASWVRSWLFARIALFVLAVRDPLCLQGDLKSCVTSEKEIDETSAGRVAFFLVSYIYKWKILTASTDRSYTRILLLSLCYRCAPSNSATLSAVHYHHVTCHKCARRWSHPHYGFCYFLCCCYATKGIGGIRLSLPLWPAFRKPEREGEGGECEAEAKERKGERGREGSRFCHVIASLHLDHWGVGCSWCHSIYSNLVFAIFSRSSLSESVCVVGYVDIKNKRRRSKCNSDNDSSSNQHGNHNEINKVNVVCHQYVTKNKEHADPTPQLRIC